MYHSVADYDEDPFRITVTPRRFARQLDWLARQGFRGVSVRELLQAHAEGSAKLLVGLTFDDGYDDFLTQVVPALERQGFTATVFVIAGRLGGLNSWEDSGPYKQLMTAEQVRRAAAAGMEIGSHSLTHVSLTTIAGAELAAEVNNSRIVLRNITGQDVPGFCYPYGYVDHDAAAAVRAAGYDYGCAIWRADFDDRHTLPRTYFGDDDGAWRISTKIVRHRFRYLPTRFRPGLPRWQRLAPLPKSPSETADNPG